MDKLIEELLKKRTLVLVIAFFIFFAFLPSFFLVFVWNREFFCDVDFLKLVVLSTSIGMLFFIFNFFTVGLGNQIYILYTGRKGSISEDEDSPERRYIFYYLFSLMLFIIEVFVLVVIKCMFPLVTMSVMVKDSLIAVLGFWGIGLLVEKIGYLRKKKI